MKFFAFILGVLLFGVVTAQDTDQAETEEAFFDGVPVRPSNLKGGN